MLSRYDMEQIYVRQAGVPKFSIPNLVVGVFSEVGDRTRALAKQVETVRTLIDAPDAGSIYPDQNNTARALASSRYILTGEYCAIRNTSYGNRMSGTVSPGIVLHGNKKTITP